MAVIKMDYYSICLMRQVSLTAVIPVDKANLSSKEYPETKNFPTLYMLHGLTGNASSLLYTSQIVNYAMEHGIAVIMPEGDNHYYVDCQTGERFGEFIGKELVNLTRKLFPLSDRREDTAIGGISMGGYGCFINGFRYTENFGSIVSMSTGVRYKHLTNADLDENALVPTDRPQFFRGIYGDLDQVAHSERSIEYLAERLSQDKKDFPKIYMCCGTDDFRIEENRQLAGYLKNLGAEVTMEDCPGGHTRQVWDYFMPRAFEWLDKTFK